MEYLGPTHNLLSELLSIIEPRNSRVLLLLGGKFHSNLLNDKNLNKY